MTLRYLTARSSTLLVTGLLAVSPLLQGCETDSYMDPSRTGYFETTPTAIPILNRIDVIEQVSDAPTFSQPTPEDLEANSIEYQLSPGDAIKVSIPRLISSNETDISERAIDQAGTITLPIIGPMKASGMTVEQLQKAIEKKLEGVLSNPKAFVEVVEARAYQFRVLGAVDGPGLYALNKPDLTVLDALALARGASPSTTRVLITRKLKPDAGAAAKAAEKLPEGVKEPSQSGATTVPPPDAGKAVTPTPPPVDPKLNAGDVDSLLKQIEGIDAAGAQATDPPATTPPAASPAPESPVPPPATEPSAPPASEQPAAPPAPEPPVTEPAKPAPQPGMLAPHSRQTPPVDIDGLEPPTAAPAAEAAPVEPPPASVSDFVFDNATKQWVKRGAASRSDADSPTPSAAAAGEPETPGLATGDKARARAKARVETKRSSGSRVIEVDYNQLVRGASNLNVIIRPDDVVYCDTGEVGVVYIGGEITRPGVYNLPTSGKLTLSRLVDAAGGLSQIAIPERVDLIRRIGGDKEACVRVNLAAIRNRAEPDIFMRPDDHVIIGTNFWATPLAVIRNGFRMTYGFGFLVDRNWGNDIFGAPPVNVVGQ